MKKRIVVLTGAGISAESGIQTFRGAGGLWEGHDIMEVASPQGFAKNPELVLDFYNKRRAQAQTVQPNPGHTALVELEEVFDVQIITQNVDNLHEKAGSTHILHLHGMLNKGRSVADPELIIDVEGDIVLGDQAPDGAQLRPHIVWFGEEVPMIVPAAKLASQADVFIIVGTSLLVYPAAGLIEYVSLDTPVYVVDPNKPSVHTSHNISFIETSASEGVPLVVEKLLSEIKSQPE